MTESEKQMWQATFDTGFEAIKWVYNHIIKPEPKPEKEESDKPRLPKWATY